MSAADCYEGIVVIRERVHSELSLTGRHQTLFKDILAVVDDYIARVVGTRVKHRVPSGACASFSVKGATKASTPKVDNHFSILCSHCITPATMMFPSTFKIVLCT